MFIDPWRTHSRRSRGAMIESKQVASVVGELKKVFARPRMHLFNNHTAPPFFRHPLAIDTPKKKFLHPRL